MLKRSALFVAIVAISFAITTGLLSAYPQTTIVYPTVNHNLKGDRIDPATLKTLNDLVDRGRIRIDINRAPAAVWSSPRWQKDTCNYVLAMPRGGAKLALRCDS
jgi:hypothetical protein